MMTSKPKQESDIVIDATNATLGRLASFVAKQALLGKTVSVVNCEKAIVVGKESNIVAEYQKQRARGGSAFKGPYFPRSPERLPG